MFLMMVIVLVLWLIIDYRKDKKIQKRLQLEKEEAQRKWSKQENRSLK